MASSTAGSSDCTAPLISAPKPLKVGSSWIAAPPTGVTESVTWPLALTPNAMPRPGKAPAAGMFSVTLPPGRGWSSSSIVSCADRPSTPPIGALVASATVTSLAPLAVTCRPPGNASIGPGWPRARAIAESSAAILVPSSNGLPPLPPLPPSACGRVRKRTGSRMSASSAAIRVVGAPLAVSSASSSRDTAVETRKRGSSSLSLATSALPGGSGKSVNGVSSHGGACTASCGVAPSKSACSEMSPSFSSRWPLGRIASDAEPMSRPASTSRLIGSCP